MACKYCDYIPDYNECRNDLKSYKKIAMCLAKQNSKVCLYIHFGSGKYDLMTYPFDYCQTCGRKLTEEEV